MNPDCNFNIFKNIRNNFGKETVKAARNFEKKTLAITRFKNHLTFNHILKSHNILPSSLKLNPPLKCPKGYAITRKMGFEFLRMRISFCHKKIKELKQQQTVEFSLLTSKLSQDQLDSLQEVVEHNSHKLMKSIKEKHKRKIDKMMNKKTFTSESSSTKIDKSRWVKNISDRNLSNIETSALEHGFGYSVTPKSIPAGNILASIESGIFNLNEISKQQIRSSVTNILRNSKPQKESNISKDEVKALINLKKDKNIVVLPADKGKAIVVMNRRDYQEKLHELLDDRKTYQKITDKRRNPVTSTEREMNTLLSEFTRTPTTHDPEKSQIDSTIYRYLHSTDATPATFYGLPKIHKPTIPLRPITSCIGSPTYNLSKHLVRILSPLLTNTYTVKNSSIFAEQIKSYSIDDDEVMVSFDVVSLFTSIPIDLALKVANVRLNNDRMLLTRTNLSIANILKLLDFVLSHCFFLCDGYYYQQVFGCPMGSPVSALLANLVMEEIEHQAISTATNPPKWWFRYVDDSHCCLKKNNVESFHLHLNSMNTNIKFTIEQENDAGLSFLDTITSRTEEGNIQVNVYRKQTHTDRYLDFNTIQ